MTAEHRPLNLAPGQPSRSSRQFAPKAHTLSFLSSQTPNRLLAVIPTALTPLPCSEGDPGNDPLSAGELSGGGTGESLGQVSPCPPPPRVPRLSVLAWNMSPEEAGVWPRAERGRDGATLRASLLRQTRL